MGRRVTIREAVDAAVPKVAKAFKNQPTIEAYIRAELGATYLWLGEPGRADRPARAGETALRGSTGRDSPRYALRAQ